MYLSTTNHKHCRLLSNDLWLVQCASVIALYALWRGSYVHVCWYTIQPLAFPSFYLVVVGGVCIRLDRVSSLASILGQLSHLGFSMVNPHTHAYQTCGCDPLPIDP